MNRQQLELLKRIMEVDFARLDLNLYLNTHPQDKSALEDYNEYLEQLKELKQEYCRRYTPLSAFSPSGYPWHYIESPWPWEINY